MEFLLLLPFITPLVLTAWGYYLGSIEGEVMLILARVIPMEMMATFALLHSPPFGPQMRWSDYDQYYMSVTTAATSLLLSGIGHTFLKVDMTFVFGLVLLAMARLVSIAGLLFWLRYSLSQGSLPRLSIFGFLVKMAGDVFRTLSSALLCELRRKPLRIGMLMLGVALVWWRAKLCWMTWLYSMLVVLQAGLQWQCYSLCGPQRGTVWGVRSGVLLVLSHLPVIVAGCKPVSEYWTIALYYMALAAYTLSAVYTQPR